MADTKEPDYKPSATGCDVVPNPSAGVVRRESDRVAERRNREGLNWSPVVAAMRQRRYGRRCWPW